MGPEQDYEEFKFKVRNLQIIHGQKHFITPRDVCVLWCVPI